MPSTPMVVSVSRQAADARSTATDRTTRQLREAPRRTWFAERRWRDNSDRVFHGAVGQSSDNWIPIRRNGPIRASRSHASGTFGICPRESQRLSPVLAQLKDRQLSEPSHLVPTQNRTHPAAPNIQHKARQTNSTIESSMPRSLSISRVRSPSNGACRAGNPSRVVVDAQTFHDARSMLVRRLDHRCAGLVGSALLRVSGRKTASPDRLGERRTVDWDGPPAPAELSPRQDQPDQAVEQSAIAPVGGDCALFGRHL